MSEKIKSVYSISIDDQIHEIIRDNSIKLDVSVSAIYEGAIIRFFGLKRNKAGKYIQTKNARVEKSVTN
jgi:hypothetical protein